MSSVAPGCSSVSGRSYVLCSLERTLRGGRIERVQSCDLRLPSGGAYASYISPNLAVALAHVNDPFMNVVRPARRPAFYPAFH